MLNFATAITAKDLRITLGATASLCQALLLGLLLIFIFSLSQGPGEIANPQEAAAIFWIGSVFYEILIFNQLYNLEETNLTRQCLILATAPCQGIWLGKAAAGFILLCIGQLFFLPSLIIFLAQNLSGPLWPAFFALLAVNFGISISGSLLGAVGQGQSGREALLTVILFPLLLPLLLGAISLLAKSLGSDLAIDTSLWLGVILAFDSIFLGAGLLLFGFLYQCED